MFRFPSFGNMRLHFLLPIVLLASAAPSTAQNPPRAEVVGGEILDFGKVRPGSVTRTLSIVNTGADTLRIGAITSGCGCLAGTPDRRELGPGDTSHLTVTIEAGGTVAELWEKALTIATNDPLRQAIRVIVRARFTRDMRIESLLSVVRREPCPPEGCAWEIVVANTADSAITIFAPVMEEVRGLSVVLDSERPLTLPPGGRHTYHATVKVLGDAAIPMARVLLLTSSSSDSELRASWFYSPQ